MNVEQRVINALRSADRLEPSNDLWLRVVHSIDEDRQYRRRVATTAAAAALTAAVLVLVGALSIETGSRGRFIDRPTLEILEAVASTLLTIALGPAIRRFGRGYASDLWPADSPTPETLLRLLDIAYFLVFGGYILLSTEFQFADGFTASVLGEQLHDAAARIGGLLLVMAILHAGTLTVLPLVALVDNSTRRSRALPRWVILLGVLLILGVLFVLQLVFGVMAAEL